ncbi:MAG: hypothetical protein H7320_23735 [Ferruginibacter sp.]|nr:hypothetical protein [Ferruginibacter sp.]
MEKETKLIQACIDDDRFSKSQLYKLFFPKIFAVCLRYFKNREKLEEIVQEGFCRVFSLFEISSMKMLLKDG